MLKNTFGGFVFVALLVAGSLFSLRDYSDPELGLQLGIDLQGGTELVYRIDRNKVAPSKRGTVLEDVKSVIASRFDAFGLKEISIATAGSDQIVLQLPGFDDASLQRLTKPMGPSAKAPKLPKLPGAAPSAYPAEAAAKAAQAQKSKKTRSIYCQGVTPPMPPVNWYVRENAAHWYNRNYSDKVSNANQSSQPPSFDPSKASDFMRADKSHMLFYKYG